MAQPKPTDRGEYIVVARRYRPQGFEDLVGQEMVSRALTSAIQTDRVGHAYLFTGARGVGKTSTARILSKALNCTRGPTISPCHECDICQSIAGGNDIDVLEIDGASNRGIDEIRQLRSNVSVRPSRSRFKIYIIDEVHMLTREAFNALLKTLEEPPDHVKFIFCTTDPEKIPITVLSRCQRFDFLPIETEAIVERLQYIVTTEGAHADIEALHLLARRAAGSLRDSQSLLEQLLSFTADRITVDAVHRMLGTAASARLHGVVAALADHNAAQALRELDQAIREGVDAGQLAEQLLGCLRDLLTLSVGGGKELLLDTSEGDIEALTKIAMAWGTPNLLAAAQILDQSIARMRLVTHSRVLLEMALIRIAHLEDLQQLADIIGQLQAGIAPEPADKKKTQPVAASIHAKNTTQDGSTAVRVAQPPAKLGNQSTETGQAANSVSHESQTVDANESGAGIDDKSPDLAQDANSLWQATIERLEGVTADYASKFESAANSAPNRLVVTFPVMYTSSKSFCQRPERHGEMERILSEVAGKRLKLEFSVRDDGSHAGPPKPVMSARQREREVSQQAFVQRAVELFSAGITSVSPKQKD